MSDAFSHWSPSTGGFYRAHLHGAAMPADAVALTEAQHKALHAGQARGQEIVVGKGGRPMLRDPKPPELPWDRRRRAAYGPIEAQLEMVYRDLKALGADSEFVRHVDAVKAAHPKPAA